MKELIHHDKIRIIQESTERQLIEILELEKTGAIDNESSELYQEIVIDVLRMQEEIFTNLTSDSLSA